MCLDVNAISPALVFLIFLSLALVHGRWHVSFFSLARVGFFVLVHAFAYLRRCSQPVIVLVLSSVLVFVFRNGFFTHVLCAYGLACVPLFPCDCDCVRLLA